MGDGMRGVSDLERRLLAAIDPSYIWRVTERLALGGEVVAGTTASLEAAEWLTKEMQSVGLQPGVQGESYVEDFTIFGWEELTTTVELLSPKRSAVPCKQYYKGAGTGPDGITAPVVYIDEGCWDDFERVDVHHKIVLFHRTDELFWGLPVLLEARARGAVGALIDWPLTDPDELKTDCIGVSLPCAYIRGSDARALQEDLARGNAVTAHLVVDNRVGHYPQAHNVLGRMPGARRPEEMVYIAAHFDHWFTSACDDCAGVGVVLGLAKAFQDAGVRPDRTLVFALFDSEELGGPDNTWYDWIMGSYSHAVATQRRDGTWGPPLHPNLAGEAVAMLNLDVVGVRGGEVFCETSPELTALMKGAAADSGLAAGAITNVYWPPGSYDDCSFFIAGVPVMQMAWFGRAYEPLYHASDDTLDKIDPKNLELTAACTLLAAHRLCQSAMLPYDMLENANVAEASTKRLLDTHPDFAGNPALEALQRTIDQYRRAAEALNKRRDEALSESAAAIVNSAIRAAVKALGTTMYSWDFTSTPGWDNLTVFDTMAHDLACLRRAIAALQHDDPRRESAAAEALAKVHTMGWGKDVSKEAYRQVLTLTADPATSLWGAPFLPCLIDVHQEYFQLLGRSPHDANQQQCLQSLEDKASALRQEVLQTASKVASAVSDAARCLGQTVPTER